MHGRVARRAVVASSLIALTACGGSSHQAGHTSSDGPVAGASVAHLRSVAPRHLSATSPIVVSYDVPLTGATALPTLSPAMPGSWSRHGSTAVFTPTRAYPPDTTVRVNGVRRTGGPAHTIATRVTPHGSLVRAQQILADLHYLPLRSTAAQPVGAAAAAAAVYSPPPGHFRWRYADVPTTLKQDWSVGKPGNVMRGAVIAFQHDAGLPMDGSIGTDTWHALLAAAAKHKVDPHQYSYVSANLYLPQRLSVWVAGKTVLTSPVNGGVASAPTPLGTYPVYERFTSTTMSGTNPDGSHYSDPGVPWVNYFSGGSAVHGFPRASYGSPQSVGCLELPIPTAAEVYQLINYGTLVTVVGPYVPPPPATAKPQAPHSTSSPSPKPSPTHSASHSPAPSPKPSGSPTHKH